MATQVPKAILNCNPFNIPRSAQSFRGLRANPIPYDWNFFQFRSIVFGIRAAMSISRTRWMRDKLYGQCTTISDELCRWYPPTECDTQSYINFVSAETGLAPTAALNFADRQQIVSIFEAMAKKDYPDYQSLLSHDKFVQAYALL